MDNRGFDNKLAQEDKMSESNCSHVPKNAPIAILIFLFSQTTWSDLALLYWNIVLSEEGSSLVGCLGEDINTPCSTPSYQMSQQEPSGPHERKKNMRQ